MKILAFSDWRTQKISLPIQFLRNLEEKPNIIIYARDDIGRFNKVSFKFLPEDLKKERLERYKINFKRTIQKDRESTKEFKKLYKKNPAKLFEQFEQSYLPRV